MKELLISCAWLSLVFCNILGTVDFSGVSFLDSSVAGVPILSPNFAGLSAPFSQIYQSDLASSLFTNSMLNSWIYGNSLATWGFSLKMQWPVGYKYQCPSYSMIDPTMNWTCILDIQPYMGSIGTFFRTISNTCSGLSMGFDMQKSNFDNFDFYMVLNDFSSSVSFDIGYIGYGAINVDLYDKADLFDAKGIIPGFTPANFISALQANWWVLPSGINGPGITEDADISWLDSFNDFAALNIVGKFTVYSVPFKTAEELTITNILNESYYQNYIHGRFTGSSGLLNPTKGSIAITDLKMSPGDGVDGVTNTMASAIWAVDFMLQCAYFGLKNVHLNVNLNQTNFQSPIGPAPSYAPRPTYYALLLVSIIQSLSSTSPAFVIPIVGAGTSQFIKAYGFYSFPKMSFVILNKDTNPNASGIVRVSINSQESARCIYLQGNSLESKEVRLGGYEFVGGSTNPVGNYTEFVYKSSNNVYEIPVKYAQIAYCVIQTSPSKQFPKIYKLFEKYQILLIGVIVLLIVAL